jgi:hypothetical protein
MRAFAFWSVVGLCAGLSTSGTLADTYVKGNDTGGIIAWSCESEAAARAIAAEHCAWYDKGARITGVHRQVGEYISFACLWNPRLARIQLPAVGVRSHCGRTHGHISIVK